MEKRAMYESPAVKVSLVDAEDIITKSPVGAGGFVSGGNYDGKEWE